MTRRDPLMRFATPVLALMAGCFLDTTPIENHDSVATGPVVGNAGAAGSQPRDVAPAQVVTGSAGRDSAVAAPVDAAVPDAAAPPVSQPLPPAASNGMTDAGTAPSSAPSGTSDAGSTKPPSAQCAGLGSYGLRATMDVTWDATAWSDVGRGTVELYGLVRVDSVDPATHAATASFRACGLSFPLLNSSALCSSYQLQIPTELWDEAKLPEQKLGGTYDCDGSKCTLQLDPASYSIGIQLADAQGPWPDVEDTTPSQFSDHDADGFPGVSVDVASGPSLPSGQNACAPTTGPTFPSSPGQGGPGPSTPTTTTPMLSAPLGRLQLGLRTQLTAAIQLDEDCQVKESTASSAALDVRSAGCFVSDATDPASASLGCNEDLRAGYDQALPQFDALPKGKAPSTSGPNPGKKTPSDGTILNVAKFAPGTDVSCEQVRSLMF